MQIISAACERVDVANVTACQGVIKNVSGRSLKGVQAIVEWLDGGDINSTDAARVPEDPLLPGQEGSWGIEATHSNGLEEYQLRFVSSEGALQAGER